MNLVHGTGLGIRVQIAESGDRLDFVNELSGGERQRVAFARALAAETGDSGITANYVQPGAIMTAVSREVFRKDKSLRDSCIAGSAAKRLGEPVDVAKVVLFLASDDAVFVSGTGIAVDGGRING